jgi:lactoylglutathione lyase
MKIDHIAIWTNDLEKEKEFFLKYFDCTVNEKYTNQEKQFSSYFISFDDGGGRIELMKKEGIRAVSMERHKRLNHFAIDLGNRANVDKLTDKMESDGIIIAGRPRVTGDGYYESVILDPEGNRVELISK